MLSGFNNRWSPTLDVFSTLDVSFRLSFIKLIAWGSTLVYDVFFVDNGVFQHKRSNLSSFSKITRFLFMVSKRLQFVNSTRNLNFISFAKRNLEDIFYSFVELTYWYQQTFFFLLKPFITELIKQKGQPALIHFSFIMLTSCSKFNAM